MSRSKKSQLKDIAAVEESSSSTPEAEVVPAGPGPTSRAACQADRGQRSKLKAPKMRKDSSDEDDLKEMAQRLQTTPHDLRILIEDIGLGPRMRRLVEKDGSLNIVNGRRISSLLPEYKKLMRVDCFTLMIFFILVYTVLLTVGSCFIYLANNLHRSSTSDTWGFVGNCWFQIHSFYDCFLLTFEIVTTIGYGLRQPNPECSSAVVLTMGLHIMGVLFVGLFVGVFLAWFNNTESGEVRFSRIGVITKDEGQMFLMIRLADPMTVGMDFLEVSGICYHINKQMVGDGDKTSPIKHLGDMRFTAFYNEDDYSSFPLLVSSAPFPLLFPTVVGHRIDQTSPLYPFIPSDLQSNRLEIIITVVGLRTETGTKILCKTSYLSEEIALASRFSQNSVLLRKEKINIGSYGQVDLDTVKEECAESYELEEGDRVASRKLKPKEN